MKGDYQRRLGERLRAIRSQQGLTLQGVEERSEGRWKAVVIGAYERGDRAISAAKLAELAAFYGVPVGDLLPETPDQPVVREGARPRKVVLDLTRLTAEDLAPALRPVSRFASTIQVQRGDYNGRMLTLRGEDVRALAVVFGLSTDEFLDRLQEEGLLVGS